MSPSIVPAYFATTAPTSWDIKTFLETEYAARGHKNYDHNRSIGSWISSLRHLERHPSSDVATCANAKLAKYFTERPSDRIVARNWYDDKKRKRSRNEKRERERALALQARSISSKVVYNGPVNNGDLFNSSLTFGAPHAPGHLSGGDDLPKEPVQTDSNATPTATESTPTDHTAPPAAPHHPADPQVQAPEQVPAIKPLDLEPEPAPEPEPSRLKEICDGLYQVYSRMTNKLSLGPAPTIPSPTTPSTLTPTTASEVYLEDVLYTYAVGLEELHPAHFCIASASTLAALPLTQEQHATVLARVGPLPAFPAHLEHALSRYAGVASAAECRGVAAARNPPTLDRDVLWIDDVVRHVVELVTECDNILLLDPLHEGVWDSLVYAPFWDKYFSYVPGLVLQRKEISLLASSSEPYTYLSYDARYDGVVQTRPVNSTSISSSTSCPSTSAATTCTASTTTTTSTPRRGRSGGDSSTRLELCLFETSSRFEGLTSRKWLKDRTKLLAGCRAMLYRLLEAVEAARDGGSDGGILRRLQVVGVLQAGRFNQLFVMGCINRNIFFLREGAVREVPANLKGLDSAFDLISTVWKARKVVVDTAEALRSFFDEKKKVQQQRTDADFL